MPPSGCALTTRMSAAPNSATASGSSDRRTLSSAAIGMPMYFVRRLISASWSIVAHGCSTYSRSNGASAWMACSASSTFQPPFASMRMRPSGPSASRTARTRATSAARVSSPLATFTFAVRHPGNRASTARTLSGSTAGTVALTGIRSRSAGGGAFQP